MNLDIYSENKIRAHQGLFPYLETFLISIAEDVELPPSKFELAKNRYQSIAEWFDKTPQETALGQLQLKIYPHGGFGIGTAKKPYGKYEFDLDMACEVQIDWRQIKDPRTIKDALKERFDYNEIYRKLLEVKTRVLRLNYAGDFHLDFLPCVPFDNGETTRIYIPHKLSENNYVWKISDPLGFKKWFEQRCELRLINNAQLSERMDNEIYPFPMPEKNKPVLKSAVILLKLARDVYFASSPNDAKAVTSIVLTTIAGNCYKGEQEISEAFINVVYNLYHSFYSNNAPQIVNPANPEEDFAEDLRQNSEHLKNFKGFLYHLFTKTNSLLEESKGLKVTEERLKALFGTHASKAITDIGERTLSATKNSLMGVSAEGALGLANSASASKILPHKFHGTF